MTNKEFELERENERLSKHLEELAEEIESLKTALRIKTEEHDCCAEDNIELRKQLAACKELLDEAENDKLENYRRLTVSRISHAASQAREQQLREALEYIIQYPEHPEVTARSALLKVGAGGTAYDKPQDVDCNCEGFCTGVHK